MYEWVLALHIIAIIAWMAGLLYLPRLFVYHSDAAVGSDLSETLKVMERRLFYAIMTPAMIASWFLGFGLAVLTNAYLEVWFHIKLLLVIILSASHLAMGKWRANFGSDKNTRSARFYRVANEVPTLLMIGIVILVTVKPF